MKKSQDEKQLKHSKPIGRPPKAMPEKIPDTPENVMRVLVNTPPKERRDWNYLKKQKES